MLQRSASVGGRAHLVSLHAQRALERLGDVLVVLDDEHPWCAGEVVHGLCVPIGTKAMVRPLGRLPGAWRRSCAGWASTRKRATARRSSIGRPATRRATRARARPRGRGGTRRLTGVRLAAPHGLPRLPALDQRGRDVLGLACVALGVFLGFVLYGGWNGGRAGHGLAVALGWVLGRARVARAGRARRGRRRAVAAPRAAGPASPARRCRLPVRIGYARAGRRHARRELRTRRRGAPGHRPSCSRTGASLARRSTRRPTGWCRTWASTSSSCSCCSSG